MTVKEPYIYESPDNGKTIYRRKMGQHPSERELITEEQLHSESWYDYTRNDPNRPIPEAFVNRDKIKKWVLPVEQFAGSDECLISLPEDLLEVAGLKEGDQVEWIDNNNGSWTFRKVQNK